MPVKIIEKPITKSELLELAKEGFGDLVKAVVDIDRGVVAFGGELHADGEAMLLERGSKQESLWGINLYPEKSGNEWIEFDSMINIRPSRGNRSRGVEDAEVRQRIIVIVQKLVREQ